MAEQTEAAPQETARKKRAAGILTSRLILGILVSLVSSAIFASVWDAVKDRGHLTTAFDRAVLVWMHTHQTPWLTTLAHGLAFMGSPPVIISIGLIGALAGLVWRKIRGAAWTLPIAVIGAGIIIQGIKVTFHRPRPSLYAQVIPEHGYSFPSGHSLIAIVVYGLLGYFALSLCHSRSARAVVKAVTALVILLIGVSRPYVQVHYPTDVIAGWTIGLPWLITCIGIHEGLTRRFAGAGEPVLEDPSAPVRAAAGLQPKGEAPRPAD